jgi:hypothetical protein
MNQLPISESAVIQRLTRKLAEQGERIKVNRSGSKAEQSLGRYVVLSKQGDIKQHTDDLSTLAEEHGVLQANEVIQAEL